MKKGCASLPLALANGLRAQANACASLSELLFVLNNQIFTLNQHKFSRIVCCLRNIPYFCRPIHSVNGGK
jgi:hypothetical protein